MSHAGYASKSLVVFLKLAAMLRIVRAVQFMFAKLAALLRGKGSDEMRASEFIGQAPYIPRSSVDQHATQSSSDHAIAVPEMNDQSDREKLIRRRWLETGIKMWNPDHHGAGHAALNIQGRSALLPPKPGETLPGYDTLEFKIVQSYVNGEAVNQIVCEGVVVDPPKRRTERSTAGAAVAVR
jgi:hypothetical protein